MADVKFKKGDVVYEILSYDNKGTFKVRQRTIQSWGKERGTATHLKNGEFIKSRIYPSHANKTPHGVWYFLVDSINPEEVALELAAKYIAAQKEHFADCRIRFADASKAYFIALDQNEAELHEPRVIIEKD